MAAFLPVLSGESSPLWYLLCIQNLPAFTDLLSHFFSTLFPRVPHVSTDSSAVPEHSTCVVNEILFCLRGQ